MNTDKYMSVELLNNILNEYQWPSDYSVQQAATGLKVQFNQYNTALLFQEDQQGEVRLSFIGPVRDVPEKKVRLNLTQTLSEIIPNFSTTANPLAHLGLTSNPDIYPSPTKVKDGIRDKCVIASTYLTPYIKGENFFPQQDSRTAS